MNKLEFFKSLRNSCVNIVNAENSDALPVDLTVVKRDLETFNNIIFDIENGADEDYLQRTYKTFYVSALLLFYEREV